MKASKFVTERQELLRIHEYNRRYTGSLYVDEKNGSFVDLLFATNDEQADVVVHKSFSPFCYVLYSLETPDTFNCYYRYGSRTPLQSMLDR